jgi:DNA-binding NarL/FixJ family response regulator
MRVVIGEDEVLLRQGLALVLERAGFDVVAMAGDGDEVVRKVRAHRPDLLVTDIRMPPTHRDEGLQAALEVRRSMPGIAVMVLSQHTARRYAQDLLSEGAAGLGYLLKQRIADAETFVADLRRLLAGGTVLDPEVAAVMVARASHQHERVAHLTPRQRTVLSLMAEGRTNAGIANRLSITEKAVTRHTSMIYLQLGLPPDAEDHRRVLAVIRYLSGSQLS